MRPNVRTAGRRNRREALVRAALAIGAVLIVAGCEAASGAGSSTDPPVTVVEREDGSKELTLSSRAAERLGIETAEVAGTSTDGARLTVPYAAVLWDAAGDAWVYAVTAPRTYTRAAIEVTRIEGDLAYLTDGPSAGTEVVTVGVSELHGVEAGVGGGH